MSVSLFKAYQTQERKGKRERRERGAGGFFLIQGVGGWEKERKGEEKN